MQTSTHPPGALTGYSHPKCYAHADGNCSKKISKEHFISATLLRQLGTNDTAKVAGLKWQQPETFKVLPIAGMASFILCERHNNALSPLDAVISKFSEAVENYDVALRAPLIGPDMEQRQFSGDDLERWMIKCLLGLTASNSLRSAQLKPACLDLLFASAPWAEGWGLYFAAMAGKPIHHSGSLLIETRVDPASGLILAADFVIRGLPFLLCLGEPGVGSSFGAYRPEALVFKSGVREKVLVLSWENGPRSPSLRLDRTGSYDGPPPEWKDWEKNG